MEYNIGITMRVTNALGYHEPRDAIAHDWPRYIKYLFPESNYFFIPNILDDAVDFCKQKNINVLIVSGGDNIGLFEKRDKTEAILIEFMIMNKLPVIGICRGMQLIHHYFGGSLKEGNKEFIKQHRATKHEIMIDNKIIIVNSYHNYRIQETSLHNNFSVLARDFNDNTVEAIKGNKILGIMWHPERDSPFSTFTKELITKFLLNNE